MEDKFENDLMDLENAYFMQLLPPISRSHSRKTMISIIVEYSPYSKNINVVFHGGSTIIKNENFFILKRDGYRKLSIHCANLLFKFLPDATCVDNVVKMPVHFKSLYNFVNFFETDKENWQIEWITKWELKKVFENQHDLLLNIESKGFSDAEMITFLNKFEKNLKRHYIEF